MEIRTITLMISLCLIVGCHNHHHHRSKVYKAPPGQVQKATGYNPASGKFHPHGGPPGQMKKDDDSKKKWK